MVQWRPDCHQIVTKTSEFFDRRSFCVNIRVCVAHRYTEARMSEQLLHRNDIDSAVHEAGSERVTERVPRHAGNPRLAASECEASLQINKRFAGLGIVENNFILFAEPPSLKNFASFGVDRNF